jgi:hypothetical protein
VSVTVLPLRVAGPERIWKLTGRPEEAVADRLKAASVRVRCEGCGKLMVWARYPKSPILIVTVAVFESSFPSLAL